MHPCIPILVLSSFCPSAGVRFLLDEGAMLHSGKLTSNLSGNVAASSTGNLTTLGGRPVLEIVTPTDANVGQPMRGPKSAVVKRSGSMVTPRSEQTRVLKHARSAKLTRSSTRADFVEEDSLAMAISQATLSLHEQEVAKQVDADVLSVRHFDRRPSNPIFNLDIITFELLERIADHNQVANVWTDITLDDAAWRSSGLISDLTAHEIDTTGRSVKFLFVYPNFEDLSGNHYLDNEGGFVYYSYLPGQEDESKQIIAAVAFCSVEPSSVLKFASRVPFGQRFYTKSQLWIEGFVDVPLGLFANDPVLRTPPSYWQWRAPQEGLPLGGFVVLTQGIQNATPGYFAHLLELVGIDKTEKQGFKERMWRELLVARHKEHAQISDTMVEDLFTKYDTCQPMLPKEIGALSTLHQERLRLKNFLAQAEILPEDYLIGDEQRAAANFIEAYTRAFDTAESVATVRKSASPCKTEQCQVLVVVDMQASYLATDGRRATAIGAILRLLDAGIWDAVVFTYDWINCNQWRDFACGGDPTKSGQDADLQQHPLFQDPRTIHFTKATDDWMAKAAYKVGFGDLYDATHQLDGNGGPPEDKDFGLHDVLMVKGFLPERTRLHVVGTEFARCVFKGSAHARQRGYEVTIWEAGTASWKDTPDNWRPCSNIEEVYESREKCTEIFADANLDYDTKRSKALSLCNALPLSAKLSRKLSARRELYDMVHYGFRGGPNKADCEQYMRAMGMLVVKEAATDDYLRSIGGQ